jgi:hypothetical protein
MMSDCRYKKTIQFYADGYLGSIARMKLEKHIKNCQQCQLELIQLEEISRATLEIAETAPDPEYWENFTSRLFHRIGSRKIEAREPQSHTKIGIFPLRLAFYLVFVLAAFSAGIWIIKSQITTSTTVDLAEPASVGEIEPAGASVSDEGISAPVKNHDLTVNPSESGVAPVVRGNGRGNIGGPKIVNNDHAAVRDLSSELRPPVFALSNQLVNTDLSGLSPFKSADQRSKISNLSHSLIDRQIMESAGRGRLSKDNLTAAQALKFDGSISRWGYAKQPEDSSKTGEQELYLLEIDLIKSK